MKAAQTKLLPTMQTKLITVSYQLEVRIVHNGGVGMLELKKRDVPPIFFPVNV